MVIPKLFSFKSSYSSDRGHQPTFSPPHNGGDSYSQNNAYDDDYDDDDGTIGDDTVNSEGTMKSILRRRNAKNNKRNAIHSVSWSNTFDTYQEGGVGGRSLLDEDDMMDTMTFETLDTYEQGGIGIRHGEEESRQDLDAVETFTTAYEERSHVSSFYPGGVILDSYDQQTTMEQSFTYDEDEETTLLESISRGDTLESMSMSVSMSEDGGTVDMEQMNSGHASRKSKKSSSNPHMPHPLPTVTDAPKQKVRRKQFRSQSPPTARKEFHNLACASSVSENTIERMKNDKYGGVVGDEDEENDMQVGNVTSRDMKKNENAALSPRVSSVSPLTTVQKEEKPKKKAILKPSKVFSPRIIQEAPAAISHSNPNNLGTFSMDELSLDDEHRKVLDKITSKIATDFGNNNDSFASFDEHPGWDASHIRAASDDESIVSLTKRQKRDYVFEQQQKADKGAGHIGLILPQLMNKIKWPTMTMFDKKALKSTLLSGTSQDVSKSIHSDTSERKKKEDDGKTKGASVSEIVTLSMDGPGVEDTITNSRSINDGEGGEGLDEIALLSKDTSASLVSTATETLPLNTSSNRDDGEITLMKTEMIKNDEAVVKDKSFSEKTNNKTIEDFDITNSAIGNEGVETSYIENNGSNEDICASDEEDERSNSSAGNSSTEAGSAEKLQSDDGLSQHEEVPFGQVIDIQELSKSNKKSKKKSKKKKKKDKVKSKRKKKNKKINDSNSVLSHQKRLPEVVIMSPSSVASEDVFIDEYQNIQQGRSSAKKNKARGKQQKSSVLWGRKNKKTHKTANDPPSDDHFLHCQDIFHPTTPSSPGKVYDYIDNANFNNDDDNNSLPSQASSCITTESILCELRVIENTAKLMYQQMILGTESGEEAAAGHASHNNVTALFTPNHPGGGVENMELMLDEPVQITMPVSKRSTAMKDSNVMGIDTVGHHILEEVHEEDTATVKKKKKNRSRKLCKFLSRFLASPSRSSNGNHYESKKKKWRIFGPIFGFSATWTPRDDAAAEVQK